jgi:hypothetical protein
MFYRKRKKFLSLNKDIADEGGDFAIFNFFEEEEKIFEKLNKKEQKFFQFFKNGYKIKEIAKKFSSFLFFLILGEILSDILKEQRSFELLNFFQEYFEVVKKYFFDNVFIFWLEIPKFLLLSLFLSLGISSAVILLVIKNFKIYKNKIKNLY